MIEENEQSKLNGGANPAPAETSEERRDGERRSDVFYPGDAPGGVNEPGEGAAETAETEEASPRARSREELENQYRNDPRFAMLFNHGTGEKKSVPKKGIKVGKIRLTPVRILILSGFFLVILLCFGGSLFYAFKDIGKYRNFSEASALLEAGKYDEAKNLFVKVLAEDPNKEAAVEAMARIYHHFGDWNNEAFFRQRIMRLNPLNQEYFYDYLESAFRARNFNSIYSLLNLRMMENPNLPQDEGALYLIAALNSGHVSNGKAFYETQKKAKADYFSETERGRFAEMLLNAPNMNREQVWNGISKLHEIQDPQVRFETINVLLHFLSKQREPEAEEEMEKLLRESVELNNFAGAPLLANYYFSHYRFDDTIQICDEYLKTKINAVMPILYGESCVLGAHPELLPSMAERIRRLRGRQAKIIASYLDALKAFCDGDDALMQTKLQTAGSTIETPLSSLMRLQLALKQDSPKEILQRLGMIMRGRPFMDFQQRARKGALQYLLAKSNTDYTRDPDLLTTYAEIATLIQTPDDDISFLQRIILTDRFNRKLLMEEELKSALEMFPGDPVFLRMAAEFYLMNGKPARAMEYIAEFKAQKDVPETSKSSMDVLHMLALDQLGRREEAEKEFRAIVEAGKDEVLLNLYFEFCVENEFIDALKSFATWLDALPKDSTSRAALPFVRAEILLSEGRKEEALDLFEKSPSDNPSFIFHAASRLGRAGRNDAAFERYSSIKDTYPDRSLVNINLSELYSEKGDAEHALSSARTAYQAAPDDLLAQYIYAKCLCEAEQYADVVTVLKFPQYKASFPEKVLAVWSKAIREQIKSDFRGERYLPALENTKHLLTYFPDDEFGRDYLERIEKVRRHETVGGRGI